jgi:hypothetical protein
MTERPPERSRGAVTGPPAGHGYSLIHLPLAADPGDRPGDAPCWANRVCNECGRLNEAEHPDTCEACGATFD